MRLVGAYIAGLVTIPVLAIAAAFLGLFPSEATPKPPQWEVSIAGRALDTSLEHRASGLNNPIAPGDTAALAGADSLFDQHCSACHGDQHHPSTLTLYPRAPQFFEEGTDISPKEAYTAIDDGIRYSAMPGWDRQLSQAEMWKLANYLSRLGKDNTEKS